MPVTCQWITNGSPIDQWINGPMDQTPIVSMVHQNYFFSDENSPLCVQIGRFCLVYDPFEASTTRKSSHQTSLRAPNLPSGHGKQPQGTTTNGIPMGNNHNQWDLPYGQWGPQWGQGDGGPLSLPPSGQWVVNTSSLRASQCEWDLPSGHQIFPPGMGNNHKEPEPMGSQWEGNHRVITV